MRARRTWRAGGAQILTAKPEEKSGKLRAPGATAEFFRKLILSNRQSWPAFRGPRPETSCEEMVTSWVIQRWT